MVGAINGNSMAQHLYGAMQASAVKNSQPQPSKATSDEATESSADTAREMSKGKIIDTYA